MPGRAEQHAPARRIGLVRSGSGAVENTDKDTPSCDRHAANLAALSDHDASIGGMQIRQQILVFDAPDLEVESTFWAGLLGGSVDADDDWHTVIVDGKPAVAVQLAPDHVAPDWPANSTPQQMHLDIYVDDVRVAHDEVLARGAKVLEDRDFDTESGYQVYADPAGHPFCLCWG